MALAPKLEMRQGQSLVMTPQLQQAIKLLQLSNLDLTAYVEAELERNPLLERGEGDTPELREAETPSAQEPGDDDGVGGLDGDDRTAPEMSLTEEAGFGNAEQLDTAESDLYPDTTASDLTPPASGLDAASYAGLGGRGANRFDDDGLDGAGALSRDPTLKEHLSEQLMMLPATPSERLIAQHLIDLVDEAGYLTEDAATIAERLGTDIEAVTDMIEWLQGFEPVGVFARSLGECLALQLRDRGLLSAPMQAVLDNLPMVARHDFAGLSRVCGVSRDALAELAGTIRRLNPKPGLASGRSPFSQ